MYNRDEALEFIPVSEDIPNHITITKMADYFEIYKDFVYDNNREEQKPYRWYWVFKYIGE